MLSTRAEDGLRLPTRTPGRENAKGGFSTAVRRGKNDVFITKTPHRPASTQLKGFAKPNLSTFTTTTTTTTRPLGDKTPLPNRLAGTAEAEAVLERPSSQRRNSRLPSSNFCGRNFETPMNKDRHWELIDDDDDEEDVVAVSVAENNVVEDERDLDELEYCAPNTLDLPYQPPFDFAMPDYKEMGKALHDLAFSFPVDDDPPGAWIHDIPASELERAACDLPPLPPLESDDPFELARLQQAAKFEKGKAVAQQTKSIVTTTTTTTTTQRTTSQWKTGARTVAATTSARPRPQSSLCVAPRRDPVLRPKSALPVKVASKERTAGAVPARPRPQTALHVAPRREPVFQPRSALPIKNTHTICKELALDYENFVFNV